MMETNSHWDRVVELARISMENPAAGAVLRLHQPGDLGHCEECDRLDGNGMRDTTWPCPTVQAIEQVAAQPLRVDLQAMKRALVPPRLLEEWAAHFNEDKQVTLDPADLPGHPLVKPKES